MYFAIDFKYNFGYWSECKINIYLKKNFILVLSISWTRTTFSSLPQVYTYGSIHVFFKDFDMDPRKMDLRSDRTYVSRGERGDLAALL